MAEPAFDPRLAPKVQLTDADRASRYQQSGHEAARTGIQLWGFYRVHDRRQASPTGT